MRGSHSHRKGLSGDLVLAGCFLGLLVATARAQMPQDLPSPSSESASADGTSVETMVHPLTLEECVQIALARQPSVLAARASLTAARDRSSAVDNLRTPTFLARNLPVRRQQAAVGVQGAQANLARIESESVYGVTYCYLSVLYADEQLRLSEAVERNLTDLKEVVNDMVKRRQRKEVVWKEHRDLIDSYLSTLRGRRQAAVFGRKRAMAGLREAMGIGQGCDLPLVATALPAPPFALCLEEVLALAASRRGELGQALMAAEATRLEIAAQAAICRSRASTFATGSDIHSSPVPPGDLGPLHYEPRAIPPEMPAYLVGSRAARQGQAADYAQRADAVAAKTQGLVALDATDAFYRCQEKQLKAQDMKKAWQNARTFSDAIRAFFISTRTEAEPPEYPNLDNVVQAGLTATQLEVEWKESHYQYLLALAALQRATAGGFCVDFDHAPRLEQSAKPDKARKNGG